MREGPPTIRACLIRGIRALRLAADGVLTVLLASACASCGKLLDHPTSGPVCESCWRAIVPLTPPLCAGCGDPLAPDGGVAPGHARCARCRCERHAVDRGRALGAYEGALRAIVHALKYDGRRSLARRLGATMRAHCGDMLAGADWIVPVPLHASRRRQRGFNQAADLARYLGVPARGALRRTRPTVTQTALPAGKRRGNVRGAFALARRRNGLQGSTVVLVDDVCTTGATLDACARILKEKGGVREVRALTAARVVTRRR